MSEHPRLSALVHSQLAKRQHTVLRDNPDWTALLRVVLELAQLHRIGVEELQALAGVAYCAGWWGCVAEREKDATQDDG